MCVLESAPAAVERVFFRHLNSKADFHLFYKNRPRYKTSERHASTLHTLKRKINKQTW